MPAAVFLPPVSRRVQTFVMIARVRRHRHELAQDAPRLKVALTGSQREEKRETSLQKIPQRRRDSIAWNVHETRSRDPLLHRELFANEDRRAEWLSFGCCNRDRLSH